MDRRLQGRVDPSDVVQDAYVDMARELPAYARKQSIPLFLWMRLVVGQRLTRTHRRHLGAEMRDVTLEVPLYGRTPQASSASLADELVANCTSVSKAVIRKESRALLQQALDQLPALDREVIALRNFEELSTREASEVLGLTPEATRKRYIRALKRLQELLGRIPGMIGLLSESKE